MSDALQTVENNSTGSPLFYLYHGTSMDRLSSICTQGLLPQPPPDSCWPEFDEIIENSDEDEPELPPEAFEPRVFATKTIEGAKEYAENHPTAAVLRIAVTANSEWHEGETDHPYFFTTHLVPPEDIEVWQGQQWVPLRKPPLGHAISVF